MTEGDGDGHSVTLTPREQLLLGLQFARLETGPYWFTVVFGGEGKLPIESIDGKKGD